MSKQKERHLKKKPDRGFSFIEAVVFAVIFIFVRVYSDNLGILGVLISGVGAVAALFVARGFKSFVSQNKDQGADEQTQTQGEK